MGEHAHAPEQLATPDQAAEIFTQLGELTTLHGANYGGSHSFGEVAVPVPESIASHFPQVEEDSRSASRVLNAQQELDHQTGQPKRTGLVGMVTFTQKERRDANLMYATRVNYHVISDDGETYRVERHVTSTEHGPHKARQIMGLGRAVTREAMERQLVELIALRSRTIDAHKAERALGLSDVSFREAQDIIGTLARLNGKTTNQGTNSDTQT